jgi:hypothetical protein
MNEQIKRLAIQAGFDFDVHGSNDGNFYGYDGRWINEDIKTFAELIVAECANICFAESKGHRMAFGEHCGIVINEHFGSHHE